ncbi:alpha/beta hydrolase [uncultured Ilyobacter sp.]|uniref:alpha/beta hydrolase n=1 Tax=uncultured Ilyobacter sp. TaxID=544433 RepID=UPI0029C7A9E1|nr:alpha/beta hydrolase [uncultured Ilyobacter sp.]
MSGKFYLDNDIFMRVWDDVKKPKGVIQIIHGMGEHSLRYESTAKWFNENEYLVYADDHRGHGYSVEDIEDLGRIEGGFRVLIEDAKYITDFITRKHPDLPIYILGHSMGSFIAQGHMAELSNFVNGYILSGSCGKRRAVTISGWILSEVIKRVIGDGKSPFIKKLIFLDYNRRVKEKSTSLDWLTRREDIVKDYIEDPLCDFVYTTDFYSSFLKFLKNLYTKERFELAQKSVPILIISGESDPVGLYGKGVIKLVEFYKKNNFDYVKIKLYTKARHELFNEMNSIEVLEDVKNWMENKK